MATKRAAMSVDIFNTTLTITFSNGKDLSLDVSKLSPEIQRYAMLHGIKQKLVDAAAITRNTETGASASIDDKYAAVKEVCDRIGSTNGTWNKERATTSTPKGANSLLVRALMQMTGRDKAYVDDYLSAKTKEQREAIKRNPRVLAVISELQAQTVVNGIDTDELLSELGDTPVEETIDAAEEPAELHESISQSVQSAVASKKPRSKKTKTPAEV